MSHGWGRGARGAGEDVRGPGCFLDRDDCGSIADDARRRCGQKSDAGAGGDHDGDGLGAGGFQDDARSEPGFAAVLAKVGGKGGSGFARNGDQGFAGQFA